MSRRGFILGFSLMLVPIFFLIAFTLVEPIIADTRFAFQTQMRSRAFYMAEAGLQMAFYEFASANYGATTHEGDGTTLVLDSNVRKLRVTLAGFNQSGDGWWEWKWNPADGLDASYSGSGLGETIRFRVFRPDEAPDPRQWRVDAVATIGDVTTQHAMVGYSTSPFQYAVFGAQDVSIMGRFVNEQVNGDIRTNGNVYLNPAYATLSLQSQNIEGAGKIIRYTDAWNQLDAKGRVLINGVAMEGTADDGRVDYDGPYYAGTPKQGVAYDSTNADWQRRDNQGALTRYQGVVRDKALGGQSMTAPHVQTTEPGGYYDRNAGLRIDRNSSAPPAIVTKQFFNKEEQQMVTVKEIDLSKVPLPSNGLIYASTPIRIVNGEKLAGNLTIATDAPIYVKGSFNRDNPEGTPGQMKSAALVTTDRIWSLSYAFDDQKGYNYDPAGTNQLASPQKMVKQMFSGDPNFGPGMPTIEVNCAWVDGAYTVSERNWSKHNPTTGEANPFFSGDNYLSPQVKEMIHSFFGPQTDDGQIAYYLNNTIRQPMGATTKSMVDQGNFCWQQTEPYLEFWAGVQIRRTGSTVHLQNSRMAKYDNSNAGAQPDGRWNTAWYVQSHYTPPTARQILYDTRLHQTDAALEVQSNPPFYPQASVRTGWWVVR